MSVCSWEAIEERGESVLGYQVVGGGVGNGILGVVGDAPSKVLWVPDHAVSKCTGCSIEFWIGRRKHHCRLVFVLLMHASSQLVPTLRVD